MLNQETTLPGGRPEPAAPAVPRAPTYVIEPTRALFDLDLVEVWRYRELLYFLVWRDVTVLYKQSGIGVAWTFLRPLMTLVLFTFVFGKIARIPSDGLPYPVFAYSALLPWNYFSAATSGSVSGLVSNSGLISKIYFPKLIVPLSAVALPAVDFAISLVALLVLMAWFGIVPGWGILLLPFFLLLALLTALSVSLWLSALNLRYRDVGQLVPIVLQFWLYASPVAYPVSMVPERWRLLYSLNPMAGVIEGFRYGLLNKQGPDVLAMGLSTAMVLVLLFGGIVFFKRMEGTFADVV